MNKTDAEKAIKSYIKPILGFALKRCKSVSDAEDLAQEIALKVFRALILRDDISDLRGYIWTVAHNALANYYRKCGGTYTVVSLETVQNSLFGDSDLLQNAQKREDSKLLRGEIAKLTEIQRKILTAYYYENKTQAQIAKELKITLSTVKWHLFDSKKNLKRGIENMKEEQLAFNPVSFSLMGFNGSAGTMGGTQAFFRSALAQNVAYCVYREQKSVEEIADCLGVSAVYVRSEVEFLREYGYLIENKGKYIANMLIDEGDESLVKLHDEIYSAVAKLFGDDLYSEIITSGLLNDERIICKWREDKNYLLWAILPFVGANSDDSEEKIKFEEVATMRPDGAFDIANVSLKCDRSPLAKSMEKWCGPSWSGTSERSLWCCRSEWSKEKSMQQLWDYVSPRSIKLLCRFMDGDSLSVDEYAYLSEQGFIRQTQGEWEICAVWFADKNISDELLSIGKRVRQKHKKVMDKIKKDYSDAVLSVTPKHLHKTQAYGLQYMFRADGWFLLYLLKYLVAVGKLSLPTDEQKSSLTTIVHKL
ncbi:MAG: sigma-70 family RNA polymerase sigma factor [Clostridia bacterium]|nr:sigma-70 family RNA polymerase sigma factor [Clostridia bacterium]